MPQRTNKMRNDVDQESQRTQYTKQEQRPMLEALIIMQTERIDILITQVSNMVNIITTLISRLA